MGREALMSETAITDSLKNEKTIARAFREFAALELHPEAVDYTEITSEQIPERVAHNSESSPTARHRIRSGLRA